MELLVIIILFVIIPGFPFWLNSIVEKKRAKKEAARIPAEIVTEEKTYEAQIRYVRFKLEDLNVTRELIADGVLTDKYGNHYGTEALLQIEAQIEKLQNQLRRLEAK